ncbi:MAG: acetylxylan esterase [Planctomycetes bacterium]|nr:acetylxylan esterase [Planctomycetota bacterium]
MLTPNALALVFTSAALAGPADAGGPARPEVIPELFESEAAVHSTLRQDLPGAHLAPAELKERLVARHALALGVPLEHAPSPVSWKTVATLERKGYTLRKVLFESRPGVPVPALLYTPAGLRGRAPAVLNVHGHWKESKRAPQVHSRCVFLARRGFVALALDAIGAGERAYQGIAYHGRQLGYQVLPSGLTLAGLQVLDNRRAIDLLVSLPEVNPGRIGVTGASGGGNQTFHIAILDPRVKAAAGVCFYGSFDGYVRGAHCACELVPGALRYADEGALAGCVAPRALMLIAAREDQGAAFRIEDARRNAAVASPMHRSLGGSFELRELEGGHDYSKAMREIMVAFFERHLVGKPPAERVDEPDLDLLGPEELRVLDGPLPEGTLYVPHLAAERARAAAAAFAASGRTWRDAPARDGLRAGLEETLGGFPRGAPLLERDGRLATEPGVELDVKVLEAPDAGEPEGVLVLLGPPPAGFPGPAERSRPWKIVSLEPRGMGATRWPAASTVGCEDYLLAQGSAVLGRPILGQWAWDAMRAAEHLARKHPRARVALAGEREMALAALLAAALDDRIAAAGCAELLASYAWPDRFADRWGLAIFVPGLLRHGDVADLCGAIEGRGLVLGRLLDGGGTVLGREAAEAFARRAGGPAPWIAVEPEGGLADVARRILEVGP